ncbi:MAG: trigger factor [Gemmatimonadota bacterium]
MPIDVSQLRVSMEEGERWRRTLSITVPSEMVRAERKAAIKKLSSRMKLPGFREGKVPEAVLEKRFGRAVEEELLDRVIGDAYRGVLRERELKPISEGEVRDIEYQPEADLSFQVSFDVAPEVQLDRLGGFRVERPAVLVTDDDVDKVLDRIREQEGSWVAVEEGMPVTGEQVGVRIQRIDADEGDPREYEFVLGQGEAIAEVERAIESIEVGGSGEFTITIPTGGSPEEISEESRTLRIFLDARKQRELPELNDELAQAAGDFQTLDELRNRIREDLEKEASREEEGRLRGALLEQILNANPFEIPESMVDQYVRSALGDSKELPEDQMAEAKEHFRPQALQAIKRYLVVSRVAESQGLSATDDELDTRIEEIATRSGTNPAEVYARLQKSGQLEQLEREVTEGKVFDFLKQESTIVEAA